MYVNPDSIHASSCHANKLYACGANVAFLDFTPQFPIWKATFHPYTFTRESASLRTNGKVDFSDIGF